MSARRGILRTDRDFHVHLGGAVPPSLIAEWAVQGIIGENTSVLDLHPLESTFKREIPVVDALTRYRGGRSLVQAYNQPYRSLEEFLTMFRAYAPQDIVRANCAEICGVPRLPGGEGVVEVTTSNMAIATLAETEAARTVAEERATNASGQVRTAETNPRADCCIAREADVRVSVRKPADPNVERWAEEAVADVARMANAMGPKQQCVALFQRFEFSGGMNDGHFAAFVKEYRRALGSGSEDFVRLSTAFDFASKPVRSADVMWNLRKLREELPDAVILYHHGELVSDIPLADRVRDMTSLLPLVDRIGHAICLGIACDRTRLDAFCEQRSPTGSNHHDGIPTEALREDLVADAQRILSSMSAQSVGIEVNPTSNLSLGGATDLSYVEDFLANGINIFLGTDDPGFLNTNMDKELAILEQSLHAAKTFR